MLFPLFIKRKMLMYVGNELTKFCLPWKDRQDKGMWLIIQAN